MEKTNPQVVNKLYWHRLKAYCSECGWLDKFTWVRTPTDVAAAKVLIGKRETCPVCSAKLALTTANEWEKPLFNPSEEMTWEHGDLSKVNIIKTERVPLEIMHMHKIETSEGIKRFWSNMTEEEFRRRYLGKPSMIVTPPEEQNEDGSYTWRFGFEYPKDRVEFIGDDKIILKNGDLLDGEEWARLYQGRPGLPINFDEAIEKIDDAARKAYRALCPPHPALPEKSFIVIPFIKPDTSEE